jgi:hypothetical protein
MSAYEEALRLVEFLLLTKPNAFGGERCRDTSIIHLIDQGLISQSTTREIEVRARSVCRQCPGLVFGSLTITGRLKRTITLAYTYDGRPLTLEKELV